MASTASPSLRLELMATGDQSGTWGDTTNTNLGTLLEQAITGYLAIAKVGTGDYTLSNTDYLSNETRNALIEFTGTPGGAFNVVVPLAEKLWVFKNSTNGAMTVKGATGTGIAVAVGTSRWLYCDGANVLDALTGTLATQAASSVAITGGTVTGLTNLTLASGAATPATNNAAALGTSSLQWADLFLASGGVINFDNGNYTLTHSAGVLTANGALSIGTGNALTAGTIELGAATDTTISRGAAGFIAVEGNRVPSPASQASGDLLYRGSTEWERLAKGTAAQVLTMNSGATAPEWAAAASQFDSIAGRIRGRNRQTGTTYTFVLGDAGKLVEGNNAAAQTYTVPPNSSVAFPVDTTVINIGQYGAGQITIAAGLGVTIRSSASRLKIAGQYSVASLVKIGTDEWWLFGDIAA